MPLFAFESIPFSSFLAHGSGLWGSPNSVESIQYELGLSRVQWTVVSDEHVKLDLFLIIFSSGIGACSARFKV